VGTRHASYKLPEKLLYQRDSRVSEIFDELAKEVQSLRLETAKGLGFGAALVMAVAIPVWPHAYSRLRSIPTPEQINANRRFQHPERSTDPQVLLAEANRFFWLNNGPKAAPLYEKAESLFAQRGDARNGLYAKIGRLRSQAETMSFVDLSRFLQDQLDSPITRNDAQLRLWCLAAKGYTDIEIDYRAEKRDWLEAEQIANELGDERWSTRASGELGVIAFLEGDSWKAAKLLGAALLSTMANGDEGGEIRFLEMLGNGMEEVNRHSEGLMLFQKAIKLAEADTDSGLPFMAYEGKAKALAALGKPDEAKAMLEDAFAKARSQQKQGHAAQLLIILSKLAAQEGHPQQAILDLENAGQLAAGVRFYRIEADAMFEMAKLYRDSGDLANAESRATQGLIASQLVGDRYYVPRNLTVLADLRARRGHFTDAEDLYEQAEDVIDGIIGADDSYWNSSIAAAMSQTYLQHFQLLVKLGDTAGAFRVIEGVRGRTLATALQDRKTASSSTPAQTTVLDADVAAIQTRLMQSADPAERQQLLDTLAEYEWRSRLAWNKGEHRFPTKSAPLYQVQDRLKPDELLLEYVLDEPNSICIVVSPHGAELHVLPVGRKQLSSAGRLWIGRRTRVSGNVRPAKNSLREIRRSDATTRRDSRCAGQNGCLLI